MVPDGLSRTSRENRSKQPKTHRPWPGKMSLAQIVKRDIRTLRLQQARIFSHPIINASGDVAPPLLCPIPTLAGVYPYCICRSRILVCLNTLSRLGDTEQRERKQRMAKLQGNTRVMLPALISNAIQSHWIRQFVGTCRLLRWDVVCDMEAFWLR